MCVFVCMCIYPHMNTQTHTHTQRDRERQRDTHMINVEQLVSHINCEQITFIVLSNQTNIYTTKPSHKSLSESDMVQKPVSMTTMSSYHLTKWKAGRECFVSEIKPECY
ncbi:hypothetical protein LSH36_108g06035 [Paralvinella palmiformis]|uniref:Uncharacterized protein n=1 Tax=Paralvinella palmiformis TaxID=53620 RepID=A0AAD9N9J6_9ANNE|nr:hypothetical protein LSH36_108g06035 [Paralvinella palmiformis]